MYGRWNFSVFYIFENIVFLNFVNGNGSIVMKI